ncbi:N-ethylmaleimide reductase [Saccharopolyspora phatthalungensis]|uniref:N-ethylmaleimide reductase n=2 Tax=Saccharopolyspora phatthalungensis TaxID=664693 RepID=A0A840QIQ5_9PSEU|nr:N-ethylmaleimide reductase [Saccharopolyspora phatthalungensis]
MTRSRADNPERAATDLHAVYYAQRAGAGLIVTEGTPISPQGVGYINVPGIHSAAQVRGWSGVTNAVHRAGGRIFAQLWHVGALSHPDLQPDGQLPVAPSAINPNDKCFTNRGHTPTVVPRALSTGEVEATVEDFQAAAANAVRAGFDGVEIHGGNGYLFSQFFARSMNRRTDRYGGTIENRARFLLEVVDAVAEEIPRGRVGVRLNPALHRLGGVLVDEETFPLFEYVARQLDARELAYLHLLEPINPTDEFTLPAPTIAGHFRPLFTGPLISATDHTRTTGNRAVEAGTADLVAFGRAFIANPDLVERFRVGAALAVPDRATFYTGGAQGYTDYPRLVDDREVESVAGDQAVGLKYAEARARMRESWST